MPNKIVYQPAKKAQPFWVFGGVFRFLLTEEESGGSSATMEILVPPGIGPDSHIHESEEEQFYVIEGELTYQVGEQTIHASSGDFIHIPRGTVHSFKNGRLPAKLLAIFAPAGAEKVFQEAGEAMVDDSFPPEVTDTDEDDELPHQ